MKTLIAIVTCHKFRDRVQACRETWVPLFKAFDVDVRFFYGRADSTSPAPPALLEDEVQLDVVDDYKFLTAKSQLMRLWAYEQGYEFVWKLDDDVYARPERLLSLDVTGIDYIGRERGPSGHYPAPYCSGFCYGLSRRAISGLRAFETGHGEDTFEDRWVGNKLLQLGIRAKHVNEIVVHWSNKNSLSGREAPHANNKVIVACEYNHQMMRQVHQDFDRFAQSPYTKPKTLTAVNSLARVCIMVKTFLRDGYLFAVLQGLEQRFPEVKIVVADDGYNDARKVTKYADMRRFGHACLWLPFDSGFGAKSNAAVAECDREYVLIGSDDFDFSDQRVRPGVEQMQRVLDADPEIGVVSGRVNALAYESVLDVQGDTVTETKGHYARRQVGELRYQLCDLTVNYSLVRRKLLEQVRWDDDVKIGGGEHGSFFLDVKNAGWKVAVVETANIYELKRNYQWQDKRYLDMRARANTPGRICLKRRGINQWVTQDGRVEIC